jgi:hypothetical protein
MTHKNAFQSSGTSPSKVPDFIIRDEGSILLLTPRTELARNWIEEHIGSENGYQPFYPTVVIEPRYVIAVLQGIRVAGLEIES